MDFACQGGKSVQVWRPFEDLPFPDNYRETYFGYFNPEFNLDFACRRVEDNLAVRRKGHAAKRTVESGVECAE